MHFMFFVFIYFLFVADFLSNNYMKCLICYWLYCLFESCKIFFQSCHVLEFPNKFKKRDGQTGLNDQCSSNQIDVEMQESCRKVYCSSNWTQYSPQLNDTAKTAIDKKNNG